MYMEQQDKKKELAKLKRLASDVASRIHDVVEDTYWQDYRELEQLSKDAIAAVDKYLAFKAEHSL